MWNPTPADVAEIGRLKRENPAFAKHFDHLLDHFSVEARKVDFYEKLADAPTIAAATEAGFGGMTPLQKAAFITRSTGGQRMVPTRDLGLRPLPDAAEREALAKRAKTTAAGAPAGKVALDCGLVDSNALALVKHAGKILPAGHAALNDLAKRA